MNFPSSAKIIDIPPAKTLGDTAPPNTELEPFHLGTAFAPRPVDIICGRGKGSWKHPGNVRYKALIQDTLETYEAAPRKVDKTLVVAQLVCTLRESGAYFLKHDKDLGEWMDIGDAVAREKTGHAIRDCLAKHRTSESKALKTKKLSSKRKSTASSSQKSAPKRARRQSEATTRADGPLQAKATISNPLPDFEFQAEVLPAQTLSSAVEPSSSCISADASAVDANEPIPLHMYQGSTDEKFDFVPPRDTSAMQRLAVSQPLKLEGFPMPQLNGNTRIGMCLDIPSSQPMPCHSSNDQLGGIWNMPLLSKQDFDDLFVDDEKEEGLWVTDHIGNEISDDESVLTPTDW